MRFFVALEIPEESRQELNTVQNFIREIVPQARLTDNEKLHLTVAFVGQQPARLKESIIEVLRQAVSEIPPFEVIPAYIDGFPNIHHPHTIWVGVKEDIDKLLVIRERVKDGLKKLGINTDERRYVPHIAVAKLKNFKLNPDQEKRFQDKMLESDFDPIKITSIKLFESIPDEGFHKHNTLAEIKLQ